EFARHLPLSPSGPPTRPPPCRGSAARGGHPSHASPDSRPATAVVEETGIRMRWTLDRGLVLGLGMVVTLLVVNAAPPYRNTGRLRDDAASVTHTHEVLDTTSDLLLTLVDAETGERGFLVTGTDEFLEPYHAALDRLDGRLASLKRLTADNAEQQA